MPANATWSIFGVGRGFLPMAMMGLIMGGHIRVGMEDNIYVNPGVLAKTNAELVERVIRHLPRLRPRGGHAGGSAQDTGIRKIRVTGIGSRV